MSTYLPHVPQYRWDTLQKRASRGALLFETGWISLAVRDYQ